MSHTHTHTCVSIFHLSVYLSIYLYRPDIRNTGLISADEQLPSTILYICECIYVCIHTQTHTHTHTHTHTNTGLISVDEKLPSTIPKDLIPSRRSPARPAVFFRRPLEGDVFDTGEVGFEFVVHNFEIWNSDESEPEGFPKGFASLSINGHIAARCARVN
jgi:hypothetical protein